MRLYLASTSPARLATLRASGIDPEVIPPNVDEAAAVALATADKARPLTPHETVELLARRKAEAVVTDKCDGFILGGDSVFELDDVTYGKPYTAETARQRWKHQRGKAGVLHSGHWLIDNRGGSVRGATGTVSSATVRFADDITDAEIDAYVATGEPLHVAGAFTIDSLGAPFITSVNGDPHTVVGLSLSTLRSLLRGFGVQWNEIADWR